MENDECLPASLNHFEIEGNTAKARTGFFRNA
jgi:hypothetical protein